MTSFERELALPVPPPESFEREVALGLRAREYDVELIHFWAREARRLGGAKPTDADFERLDREWTETGRRVAIELIAHAEREAARIRSTLESFPEPERPMAWTRERALLGSTATREKLEHEYRTELLGDGYLDDPSWVVRVNNATYAGDQLHEGWLAWRRTQNSTGRFDLPRNRELEADIRARANLDAPRFVFADWLAGQRGGASLAEFIGFSLGDPARRWRAELLLELDPGVLGGLAPEAPSVVWERGLMSKVQLDSRDLRAFLAHPAASTVDDVEVVPGLRPVLPDLSDLSHPARLVIVDFRGHDHQQHPEVAEAVERQLAEIVARLRTAFPQARIEIRRRD